MKCTHRKLIEQRRAVLDAAPDVEHPPRINAVCPSCGVGCRPEVLHARGKSLVIVEVVPEASAASVWVMHAGDDLGLGAVFEHQAA